MQLELNSPALTPNLILMQIKGSCSNSTLARNWHTTLNCCFDPLVALTRSVPNSGLVKTLYFYQSQVTNLLG